MKQISVVLAVVVSLFLGSASTASAEGGSCPQGYYPIGGQGAQGCAPIPGGSSGSGGQSEVPANSPTGHWIKTWGSIASSTTSDDVGVSDGKRTKDEAEKVALSKCTTGGGGVCKITMSYFNQCVSWLIPKGRTGRGEAAIASGPSPELARFSAQAHCKNDGPGPCEQIYANCTKPIFEEF
ncbi:MULTISPECIES: DUF4189 domain-containing protein [unclassified Stenotrophomonas maltophilia group]|uniref:DUF4189 domain-containing protein n=1 Tax=unclassified Stenotrophomonas maltophilia group TaxID=2961925 RepID=UPI000D541FF8|nr:MULTISPECIES: DUF4189 domain-containing protein [unclassified Stenotrophomonas maltophilia group]AWH31252.1 hypothetical protein C1931_11750 [Stenotrophomonas sp. YAU14A_MKIMI4_1]AWH35165.1 hypothetical protein C1930_11980 [Stenotrophomonas sp. SAU14A_NAIMI4_8]